MDRTNRRAFLGTLGGGAASFAGCLGRSTPGTEETTNGDTRTDAAADGAATAAGSTAAAVPTTDRGHNSVYTVEELVEASQSGGPGPDGIPAIERPQFTAASDAPPTIDGGDPVFGVSLNGEAKAYPQSVLVWHEIVNDVVGGEAVSVTYCPLTGTAQGFYRGDTTFGVSGQLINTNLVMFDRATESWWPQMLAMGITGDHVGEFLEEFQVVWTTWDRWRSLHPDTVVLTADTGFARDYGRDPYGSYNPPRGYYAESSTLFAPLANDDRLHAKDVVIGMRTENGAAAVEKDALREAKTIEMEVGGVPHLEVYDAALDTGYVYQLDESDADGGCDADGGGDAGADDGGTEPPGTNEITWTEDGVDVDGTVYAPEALPFHREIAFDAMWVAWYGYYPEGSLHR